MVMPRTVIDAPPPAVPRPVHAPTAVRLYASASAGPERRRGWPTCVVLISASAALAGWYLTEGRFTTAPVPRFAQRAEAERVAAKVGLSVDFSEAYSETVTRGMVVSTKADLGPRSCRGQDRSSVQGP